MSYRPSRLGRQPHDPSVVRALSVASLAAPNPHHSLISDHTLRTSAPFDCWTLRDHQKGHVRALEPSPSGEWLLSAADDATVLFINFYGGWAVAKLTLYNTNGRFEILAAVWCSEIIVLCGGSNGFIYFMEFDPQNGLYPISLRVILSPMLEQVSSMKIDASRTLLAIAYGTSVAIYSRDVEAGFDSWEYVDRVAKPSADPQYLVHGIRWFGQAPCKLLVGYVAGGMAVWESPQRMHFFEKDLANMCTVGAFCLSGDETFLATTTLEQTVVMFPMSHYGPVIEEAVVYKYPKAITKMLVLPVVISASDLVLCGSAVSDVNVVHRSGVPAYVIKGGLDYIRAIASFGDLIAVASSGAGDYQIKCYMFQARGDAASWARGSAPEMKHITCAEALVAGKLGQDCPTATISEVSDSETIQPTIRNPPAPATKKNISSLKRTLKPISNQDPNAKPVPNRNAKASDTTVGDQNYATHISVFIIVATTKLVKVGEAWLRLDGRLLVSYLAIGLALTTIILATTPPGAVPFSETWKPSNDKQIYKANFDADEMILIWAIRSTYKFLGYQFGIWIEAMFTLDPAPEK
ncbi:hypothetical protein FRC07_009538 [Ceratobasidium sp. 392]|nr:hypothetical protein FRC07_009538 [Ceratobasidium sp. 392]